MKDEERQKNLARLQFVASQLRQAEEQQGILQEKITELAKVKQALEDLKSIKRDAKTYSQVGSGVYVESKFASADEVLVAVGAGVVVKKEIAEAQKVVDEQLAQTQKYAEQVNQGVHVLTEQAVALQGQLEVE